MPHAGLGLIIGLLGGTCQRASAALYREAIALDDKLASAWINLGNALAQTGDTKAARAAYEKARAIDPADPRVKAVLTELDAIEKGAAPR